MSDLTFALVASLEVAGFASDDQLDLGGVASIDRLLDVMEDWTGESCH
jgi:hypothetical protein